MAFGNKQKAQKPAVEGGEILADGSVCYKITCDKDIDPSGVFWSQTLPATASEHTHKVTRTERARLIAQIRALVAAK